MDGMSHGGPDFGSLIDEEFLMNVVEMGLKEVFPSEFESFLGKFPLAKKNLGKAKIHAWV